MMHACTLSTYHAAGPTLSTVEAYALNSFLINQNGGNQLIILDTFKLHEKITKQADD